METGRRLVQSVLPSRMSSTRLDSRPTTLLGTGGPARSDYIDNSIPEPGYGQYPHQQMEHDPSSNGPRVRTKPELVEASDALSSFRTLVGIDNSPALTTGLYSGRKAENLGIYGRVVAAETSSRQKYKVFSVLINVCLGLQLVVAAALTALGAGNGPHKLVTALGGINTVIAGLMTYLKGSGFPHRLKYFESEWTKVREFIEQIEREFSREGCLLNVEDEVRLVVEMYEDVKGDIETNSSEGILSASSMQKKLDAQKPRPTIARALSYGPPPQSGQYQQAAPYQPSAHYASSGQFQPSAQYPIHPPERAMSPGKEKEKEVTHIV